MTCQVKQDYEAEIDRVKKNLLSNVYTCRLINSGVHKSYRTRDLEIRVVKPVCIVSVPLVRGS